MRSSGLCIKLVFFQLLTHLFQIKATFQKIRTCENNKKIVLRHQCKYNSH